MNKQLLNIGMKIFINYSNNNLNNFRYISQIVDVIDETQIIITSPLYKSGTFRCDIGQIINILSIDKSGLYIFKGIVIDSVTENKVILYKIKITSDFERLQRRNFYRLETNATIIYSYTRNSEEYYGQGITKDISGGGIKFVCADELKEDTILSIFIRLDNDTELNVNGKVIRCQKLEVKKFEIGLEFEEITSKKRDELVKYIFSVQRENLRKNNN